jgi:hypothetical protein
MPMAEQLSDLAAFLAVARAGDFRGIRAGAKGPRLNRTNQQVL